MPAGNQSEHAEAYLKPDSITAIAGGEIVTPDDDFEYGDTKPILRAFVADVDDVELDVVTTDGSTIKIFLPTAKILSDAHQVVTVKESSDLNGGTLHGRW